MVGEYKRQVEKGIFRLENVYEPAANLSEPHHLSFDDPQLAIGEQEPLQMALACLLFSCLTTEIVECFQHRGL